MSPPWLGLVRFRSLKESLDTRWWLDLSGTPIEHQDGFDRNGIVVTEDGRYLIVTHSSTEQLFRIDTQSRQIREIDLREEVTGDGRA